MIEPGEQLGPKADETLLETDGLAMAGLEGPTVILAFGDRRLYLKGVETLENLSDAIEAAYDEHARRIMEAAEARVHGGAS